MAIRTKIIFSLICILILFGGVVFLGTRNAHAPQEAPTPTPFLVSSSSPTPGTDTSHDNLIRVWTPIANQAVKSPLLVEGEARGTWYFEASFPVGILDGNGTELGVVPAQAQGDWMTQNFVPFKAELKFAVPATETGTLVLEKDNPSGLPEHDDQIRIPIRFDLASVPKKTIKLYYYIEAKDKDAGGNIQCSRNGLESVLRQVPVTITPVQDAIRLLLKGELTADERSRGITSEYPLEGFGLQGASSKGGVLTLEFFDPQHKTSGGSCRASILWYQIEATAKQFIGAGRVIFAPESLFQP